MIRQSASTDADLAGEPVASSLELASLRKDYPGFRVWQEVTGDRVRYVARRLPPGIGPHTVVTADLGELRAVLDHAPAPPQAVRGQPLDTGAPNIARMYDRWLGGKDNFETDRHAADAVAAEFPEIVHVARANRQFVIRAVTHVAANGISQYIDVGAGLPRSPAVHQIAQQADPAARVAYVDNDPVVLAHARAILAAGPDVAVIAGDLRQPAAILTRPGLRDLIDLGQPVCVILTAVLHFLPPSEADTVVATFRQAMAPGSYLIASSGTSTGTSPALINRLAAAYQDTATVTGRTVEEIAGYFTGLQLVPPGLIEVWAWRPGTQRHWPPPRNARILGAVARQAADTAAVTAQQPGKSVAV
jgi:O-methyltransferase involved in polyketide biosynthesis